MTKVLVRNLVAAALTTGVVACSSMDVDKVLPDKAVEYKRETQAERNLELPPDLTSDRINDRMSVPDTLLGESTSYSEYVTDRRLRNVDQDTRRVASASVLPDIRDVEVRRDGDVRWLYVAASADVVWPRIIDFWQENGILMEEQDPTVGIMRTAWLENRANISRDFVTNTVRRFVDGLYETGLRDQYRVRLERAPDGNTEVYLTHFGMEEQVASVNEGEVERTIWSPRPRDPQLEIEMLRRLMVFLGAADERARAQLAARGDRRQDRSQLLNARDGTQLLIAERFDRAWRLVGLTLDRVGFAVEDRDRSAGIYYVRYKDPAQDDADKGWLSSLAFWSDKDVDKVGRYQVRVADEGERTVVQVADEQGATLGSPTAIRILTLLHEQIR